MGYPSGGDRLARSYIGDHRMLLQSVEMMLALEKSVRRWKFTLRLSLS
jgi:hypothetical protein